MDLVELQQSAKRIRNPFGFDFVWTWNKKPIVVKGDGKWKTVIGRLRDHLAWHLYCKVRNQYHDEQVEALRTKGQDREARAYRVPANVEDKIWEMITGEHLHKDLDQKALEQQKADLHVLKNEIDNLDARAAGNTEAINVSNIIDNANAEAIEDLPADKQTTKHQSGSAQVNDEVETKDEITEKLEEVSETEGDVPAKEEAAHEETKGNVTSDFADLDDADKS